LEVKEMAKKKKSAKKKRRNKNGKSFQIASLCFF